MAARGSRGPSKVWPVVTERTHTIFIKLQKVCNVKLFDLSKQLFIHLGYLLLVVIKIQPSAASSTLDVIVEYDAVRPMAQNFASEY